MNTIRLTAALVSLSLFSTAAQAQGLLSGLFNLPQMTNTNAYTNAYSNPSLQCQNGTSCGPYGCATPNGNTGIVPPLGYRNPGTTQPRFPGNSGINTYSPRPLQPEQGNFPPYFDNQPRSGQPFSGQQPSQPRPFHFNQPQNQYQGNLHQGNQHQGDHQHQGNSFRDNQSPGHLPRMQNERDRNDWNPNSPFGNPLYTGVPSMPVSYPLPISSPFGSTPYNSNGWQLQ